MSWIAPVDFVVGLPFSVPNYNILVADVRDLDRRTSPVGAYLGGPNTTTSATYADLAGPTSGPAVTATIGSTGKALVCYSGNLQCDSPYAVFMTYAISGASTYAALDDTALAWTSTSVGGGIRIGQTILHSVLNVGATTFATKFRGTGGTMTYNSIRLAVTPLGA